MIGAILWRILSFTPRMRIHSDGEGFAIAMDFGAVKPPPRNSSVHGVTRKMRRMLMIRKLASHKTGKSSVAIQKANLVLHDGIFS